MQKKNKDLFVKVIKYGFGGGLAAALDIFLLWYFTEFFGIHYILSAILAFVFSFFFGFYYQKFITFKSKSKKHVVEGVYFFIFQFTGLGLNIFLLWIFVSLIGFNYIWVAIVNKGIIFIWNFIMNYLFNFKHGE